MNMDKMAEKMKETAKEKKMKSFVTRRDGVVTGRDGGCRPEPRSPSPGFAPVHRLPCLLRYNYITPIRGIRSIPKMRFLLKKRNTPI